MTSKRKPGRSARDPRDAVRDEMRRHLRFLRDLIRMKDVSPRRLSQQLGWLPGKIGMILEERTKLTYVDLLQILQALGVEAADFFRGVYPMGLLPNLSGLTTAPLALNVRDAARRLRTSSALRVGRPDFAYLYIRREWRPEALMNALREAHHRRQPARWLVAGPRGAGLTTELKGLVHYLALESQYLPCPVDFDPHELPGAGAELILARALESAMHLFEMLGIELAEQAEMVEALKAPAVRPLTGLLKAAAKAAKRTWDRELLLSVEGLEHLPLRDGFRFFDRQLEILFQCKVSWILAMPASLLATRLHERLVARTSLLPPVPMVEDVLGFQHLHPGGLRFYEALIGRYLPLDLITAEARRELARLSAGIVGDMLSLTSEACAKAKQKVEATTVRKVLMKHERSWSARLEPRDLSTLRQLLSHPFRQDSPSIPRLVEMNALIVETRREGLAYRVHPVLRSLLSRGDKK